MKLVIRWRPLALIALAVLGLALRLYGLNWDDGNSFHPDEREILFHVVAIARPTSWAQFLDAAHSPLNPQFFAYGSFPIYLLAALGAVLKPFFPALGNFATLTLLGRVISALFDSGTIVLTALLALLLVEDEQPGRPRAWAVALLAAALVVFTPLQLQLSHFYAVDTILVFFITLTVLACVALVKSEHPLRWALLAGLGYGLALATKFSAAPLIVPLGLAFGLRWWRQGSLHGWGLFVLSLVTTGLVFFVAMPYAFLDARDFIQQVSFQGDLARGLIDLPYVRQFAGTIPYLYELQNMVLWGQGLTLGLAALAGLLWLCWYLLRQRLLSTWLVPLSWVAVYGAITGSFYVKFMRYMLPLYPFLALLAALLLLQIQVWLERWLASRRGPVEGKIGAGRGPLARAIGYGLVGVVLAGTAFQGLALLNVYSEPNTRVMASRWIYAHLPPGSVLTYEQWDDPLPVPVDGHDPSIYRQATYLNAAGQPQTGLDLYGDDTPQKACTLAKLLPTIDAITMPTDRLDKSIPRLPARYPLTIHYYQLLFSGQLGFHLAAQFVVRPHLFGITLDDSGADESYSVFDHPVARIFVRDTPYPYTPQQLFEKLVSGVHWPQPVSSLSCAFSAP
ncbi:MAG: phospholipid carrier-dependent glycosyltransferase [Thermogemmatispora sp.]|uniref:phospholipid carrier-dependent glycosyltransferase n=1 Tax=Thermogemmatispora sp. TaxID=1968838 RepID=UPI002636BDBF|nr:phospholipid carrier-dependent glycosyltransferase [Thermogemmatispora sp.]MBX5458797.1 phospholipid carrier-dependent glycosyltransferase [Thermogemmatispora sp.]